MPLMSRIADSSGGRAARMLLGFGVAALPAYGMLDSPAAYCQELDGYEGACNAPERIKNLSKIMEDDMSMISKALDNGEYAYCEVKLLKHLENLRKMEDSVADFIRCEQSSGKEMPPKGLRNIDYSFETLKKRRASAYCTLGGIYLALGDLNKAMENCSRGLDLNPSHKPCSEARKFLLDKTL
jgi:tetratricopeptide (TPR) repeat protein